MRAVEYTNSGLLCFDTVGGLPLLHAPWALLQKLSNVPEVSEKRWTLNTTHGGFRFIATEPAHLIGEIWAKAWKDVAQRVSYATVAAVAQQDGWVFVSFW